jgi:hypothetical protein
MFSKHFLKLFYYARVMTISVGHGLFLPHSHSFFLILKPDTLAVVGSKKAFNVKQSDEAL